jgi:Skp family chaperone for outer membrane proteins
VVIVGVDPRWLNNALSVKYENLFGNIAEKEIKKEEKEAKKEEKKTKKDATVMQQSEEENSVLTGLATSYDYLEKIFQIPFAIKPINKTGREKLLKYLIKDEMAEEKKVADIHESTAIELGSDDAGTTTDSPPKILKKNGDNTKTTAIDDDKQKETKKTKERLVFTTSELAYMQQVSPLFGQTPRTINRYVNIYRIIKAHGNLKTVGDFSKEEFMPIMFMLGVIVGCSAFAEEFIDRIAKAQDGDLFKDFIDESNFPEKLKKLIKPVVGDIENLPMKNFKRNIELISRFSFRILLKEA